MKAKIIGTGSFCPQAVSDTEFIKVYGKKAIAVSKLLQHHSRFSATDITTGECLHSNIEMGVKASISAIDAAHIDSDDIDMIIYSTATPDYIVPPCFAILQEKLKIKKCIGFDIRSGCAGFGTALVIAENYIKFGMVKNVLVVGADLLSTRFSELQKIGTEMSLKMLFNNMFFGDGAGAMVLSSTNNEDCGIYYSNMSSNAAEFPMGSCIEVGGSLTPYPCKDIKTERWPIYQASGLSDEYLPKILINAMLEMQNKGNIRLQNINKFIMPVESKKIKEKVLEEFPEITEDKIFSCGSNGGAMINAAVPISLDIAVRSGNINKKDNILIYAAENTKWQHAVLVTEW